MKSVFLTSLSYLLLCSAWEDATTSPPSGNNILMRVRARGYQMYKCNSTMSWNHVQAWAELFHVHDNMSQSVIGYHYFLPYPDANGGKPTWSLFNSRGKASPTANPASTITGKVIVKALKQGKIDALLLQATSYSGGNQIAYIQRIPRSGGLPPDSRECNVENTTREVPYESEYVFWRQTEEQIKLAKYKRIATYFGEGFQHYTYNGSAWSLTNATAVLSSTPGRPAVGAHYFLAQKDANGGQPTWETCSPRSSVTAKVVNKIPVNGTIPSAELDKTSSTGSLHGIARATKIERLSTRGGLPPDVPGTFGEVYLSPYSAVYWFYKV